MRKCGQGRQEISGNKHDSNSSFSLSKRFEVDNPFHNVNVTWESQRVEQVGCKSA